MDAGRDSVGPPAAEDGGAGREMEADGQRAAEPDVADGAAGTGTADELGASSGAMPDVPDGNADEAGAGAAADGDASASKSPSNLFASAGLDDSDILDDGGSSSSESALSLREQVKEVPQLPGVYLWKNAEGEVIYVGKAKQLRSRMMQYIQQSDERVMIPFLMEQARSFDYIVVDNEHEALVLEKNLINQYEPYFNVDFRDDKSYPYIAITEGDRFPAIKYTREKHIPTTRYFGPYTDSRAARNLIDVVRHVIPICSASCVQYKAMRRQLESGRGYAADEACFDHHVGLGPGPCCGACTEEEYAESVAAVERFLSGQRREVVDKLQGQMDEAAANLDFERAARYRDRIETVQSLRSEQHVELSRDLDCDVVGFCREDTISGVNVFVVREGAIVNTCEFILDKGLDVPIGDLVETFLVRYYDRATEIPREVVVEDQVEDAGALEEWLTGKLASKHGAKVHIKVPVRGEKHDLLQLAQGNARHSLQRFKVRTRYDEQRVNEALLQLESALALPGPPMRIECYDISTIHGKHSVASMVVFTGGRVDSSQYRRFKIKMKTPESNDVAMMRETLERRFSEKNRADGRFGSKPDLIVLDGGKPQLNAVHAQLEEMGLGDIPLAGLAKSDEELYVTWSDEPVYLPLGSSALYLVKHVRDEAHRFAITYHRQLRGKGMTESVLDSVPGLGPKRKRLLLREFGSVKNLRKCSVEQIAAVKGIPRDVAEEVVAVLDQVYNGNDSAAQPVPTLQMEMGDSDAGDGGDATGDVAAGEDVVAGGGLDGGDVDDAGTGHDDAGHHVACECGAGERVAEEGAGTGSAGYVDAGNGTFPRMG